MKHAAHILVVTVIALSALGLSATARPVVKRATTAPVVADVPVAAPANVTPVARYDSAPWWSASHVIAQTGTAFVELPANRADFSATFRGVGKDVVQAKTEAVTHAQGLVAALAKYDATQAGVTTGLAVQALYEQYRDSDGNKVDNARGDKINGYEVLLTLSIDVRDMTLLEKIFAQMQAASPTSATDIAFSLQPGNAAITQLAGAALRDARARAMAATEAAGGQLGAIRLVDPTGRACHSDLLAPGLQPGIVDSITAEDVGNFPDKSVAESMQRVAGLSLSGFGYNSAKLVPSPEEALNARALANAFIQTPPMQTLTAQACVVYDLQP